MHGCIFFPIQSQGHLKQLGLLRHLKNVLINREISFLYKLHSPVSQPDLNSADPATRDAAIAKLQSDFACLALTGIDGDPVEMGLESMKSGLENNQVDNFLRENAFLAVIFVSDENDCSDGT